jgi:hypothetical protein
MCTKFFKIFACAALIAGATGATAPYIKLPPGVSALNVQRAVFDVSGIGDGSFYSLSLRTFQ